MNIAYSLMVTFVWFLSTYFMVVFLLILVSQKRKIFTEPYMSKSCELPAVSIIVPAYNEESTIAHSIASLRKIDYPAKKLEIIIVSDGSKDRTSKIVRENLKKDDNIIFLDNRQNKGKAACLNQAILLSKGEFVACMDADSEVATDILIKTLPYFQDRKVGAVTVSVEVKDPKNLLEKIIDIEYIIGLSLSLKALSFINAVHVTPGPFSIYRRTAIEKVGLFDITSITEDLEIAYRIQKHRFRIENCTTTKVRTVIPRTLKSLYVQRKRWYSGALLTLMKHKEMIFNSRMGLFSIVMPYTFLLTIMGFFLFGYSIFLLFKNMLSWISLYSLTNFNFFSHLFHPELDLLNISSLSFFGIISLCFTVFGAIFCLRLTNKEIKQKFTGLVGFMLLFFLYQIFWASSYYSVIFKRRLKWR
jgi:cellulose synthase/poly-beta-1,6-N-acetylglucosamine synthase-like glycosyltransferase